MTGSVDFWYRVSRDAGGFLDDETGGMNGEDIGVADETPCGRKFCLSGVDGSSDESCISNGGLFSLTCFFRFSYEEYSMDADVTSSSPAGWPCPGARGVLCEEILSELRSISSPS